MIGRDQIIKALSRTNGNIIQSARLLKCKQKQIMEQIKNDIELQDLIKGLKELSHLEYNDKNENLKALAYSSAEKLLINKSPQMTIFILRTLGGMVEKTPDVTIQVNVIDRPYQRDEIAVNVKQLDIDSEGEPGGEFAQIEMKSNVKQIDIDGDNEPVEMKSNVKQLDIDSEGEGEGEGEGEPGGSE